MMRRIATIKETKEWFKAIFLDGATLKGNRAHYRNIMQFEASLRHHNTVVVPQQLFNQMKEVR